jgi:hypothetical protein
MVNGEMDIGYQAVMVGIQYIAPAIWRIVNTQWKEKFLYYLDISKKGFESPP